MLVSSCEVCHYLAAAPEDFAWVSPNKQSRAFGKDHGFDVSWTPPVKVTLDKVTVFDDPLPFPGMEALVVTMPQDMLPALRGVKCEGICLSLLHTSLHKTRGVCWHHDLWAKVKTACCPCAVALPVQLAMNMSLPVSDYSWDGVLTGRALDQTSNGFEDDSEDDEEHVHEAPGRDEQDHDDGETHDFASQYGAEESLRALEVAACLKPQVAFVEIVSRVVRLLEIGQSDEDIEVLRRLADNRLSHLPQRRTMDKAASRLDLAMLLAAANFLFII